MNSHTRKTLHIALMAALSVSLAQAQTTEPATTSPQVLTAAPATPSPGNMPDAPRTPPLRASVIGVDPAAPPTGKTTPKYSKYVEAGETAQPLTSDDKAIIAFRQLYAPLSLLGEVTSAGYSQAVNGAPNYGTNGKAFAQRLGASVARGSSQELFSDGFLAPMMHMDPRYYVQGPSHSFVHRTFYAVTRVLVSKTDHGRTTVNAPLLLGYAGASAMSDIYYPQINRNFKDTASEYGGSLGGAAIGFVVSEFSDSLLKALHMKSK